MEAFVELLEFFLYTSAGIFIYFAPTLIVHKRNPLGAAPIFNTNLYLGWTVIGWLFALYLSLRRPMDGD